MKKILYNSIDFLAFLAKSFLKGIVWLFCLPIDLAKYIYRKSIKRRKAENN